MIPPHEIPYSSEGERGDLEEDFEDDLDGFPDVESDIDQFLLPVDYESEGEPAFASPKTGDHSKQYRYSKLEETQFRLLVLKSGSGSADCPIQCELRIEKLRAESCPPFEALSYTWGDRNNLFKIWIDEKFIRVTGNLRDALQNLRYDHQERLLWVDAVCINQSAELEGRSDGEELDEKTMQVRQMGSIYEKASSVLIWLGLTRLEDDRLSDGQLKEDHFSQFLDTSWKQKDQMEYWKLRWANWPHEKKEVRESFEDLLRHDWFERVWIVQEVARSQSAFIHRGKQSVSVDVFAQLPQLLGVDPETHCQQILNIMPGVRGLAGLQNMYCDTRKAWMPRELRTLLHDFKECKSSRAEDKIYALLGLSVEQGRAKGALALDYNKTEDQVVRDTINVLFPRLTLDESLKWTLAEFWGNLDTLESALLIWAAGEGHDAEFQLLLQTKTTTLGSPYNDSQLRVAFFSALEHSRAGIVTIILQTGRLDVNSRSDGGHTPLEIASRGCSDKHISTMVVLLSTENIDTAQKGVEERLYAWWCSVLAAWRVQENRNTTTLEQPLMLLIKAGMKRLDDSKGDPLLMRAILDGNHKVGELLLTCSAGSAESLLDSRDLSGRTCLSWAAEKQLAGCVELLLRTNKLNVNSRDQRGRTPLSYAAESGATRVVKLLLGDNKVRVDLTDCNGLSPLSYAAQKGGRQVVKLLLDTGMVNLSLADSFGRSPLSYAAEIGATEVAKLLLREEGVKVDLIDHSGCSPFNHAVRKGRREVVKLLLETEKVDLNLADGIGRTPLSYAAEIGATEVVELLLRGEGVEVDLRDYDRRSPLSHAAQRGRTEVVRLLLGTGLVDLNSKDSLGRTPLSFAVYQPIWDITYPLHNPLVLFEKTEIVKLFLETEGCKVDLEDAEQRTPLSYAAQWYCPVIMGLLLGTKKVNVDSRDYRGRTPLSWAAQNSWSASKTINILLETGNANPNIADRNGKTPLFWARRYGGTEAAEILASKMQPHCKAQLYNQD